MDPLQREALSSLRLSWAPTADDLWHSQGAFHVPGFNDKALDEVMSAFADAGREQQSSPLGVVVQGPAGSGKTHLLGQVRERVQEGDGFFFVRRAARCHQLLGVCAKQHSAQPEPTRRRARDPAQGTALSTVLSGARLPSRSQGDHRRRPLDARGLDEVRQRTAHGGPGNRRSDPTYSAGPGVVRGDGLRRPGRRAGVPQLRRGRRRLRPPRVVHRRLDAVTAGMRARHLLDRRDGGSRGPCDRPDRHPARPGRRPRRPVGPGRRWGRQQRRRTRGTRPHVHPTEHAPHCGNRGVPAHRMGVHPIARDRHRVRSLPGDRGSAGTAERRHRTCHPGASVHG